MILVRTRNGVLRMIYADSRVGLAHERKAAKKNVSKEHAMRTRSFDERNNGAKYEHHVRPANRTFTRPRSCLVRNTFDEKYTNQPVDTLLVMAPGVSENVILAFTEKLILKRSQSAEEILLMQFKKKRYSRMIMIIPFATDNGYIITKTEGKVNLTTNQRFAIARGREQGRTLRQLAEQFKVDRSTFGKFLKRWRAQNGQPGKRRHSRAPVTNHQTDRNIVRASRSNTRLSAPEVLDQVSPRGSPVASVRTIRRRLNDAGMFGKRPVKKPYISDRNRAARVAWARAHLNWTQSQWERVL
uniref:HTH_Tnp_Tc3_2 domain-containing protein n=1 Tax=Caenorhabditis japonica TaxID=281687 RepID=A0A8R1IZD0_CAEJA